MQEEAFNRLNVFDNLTITQQMLFLVESEVHMKETPLFLDRVYNAILGAILAELFINNEIELINDKITVINTESSKYPYVNKVIRNLSSLQDKEKMDQIINDFKNKAEDYRLEILDNLIKKGLLVEKRGLIPFLSSKKIQLAESELLVKINSNINKLLTNENKPEKIQLYLLALLYAIDYLQIIIEPREDYEKKIKRLEGFMAEEKLAIKIYEAVKNQPKYNILPLFGVPQNFFVAGLNSYL